MAASTPVKKQKSIISFFCQKPILPPLSSTSSTDTSVKILTDSKPIEVVEIVPCVAIGTPAPPSPKVVERENKNAPLKAPGKSSSNAPKATSNKTKKEPKLEKDGSGEKKPRQARKQAANSNSKVANKKSVLISSATSTVVDGVESQIVSSQPITVSTDNSTITVIDIVSADSSKDSAVFSSMNHNDTDSLCLSESDAGEVDHADRLTSSSTPVVPGSSGKTIGGHEEVWRDEVSNFYISPSCSRLSTAVLEQSRLNTTVMNINEALREAAFRLDEPGIAATESDSAKEESDADVEDNSPIRKEVSVEMDLEDVNLPLPPVSSPQPTTDADQSESSGRRKRKPANFFDPTPVSMRNVKKKSSSVEAVTELTAEAKTHDSTESVAIAIDMTEDALTVNASGPSPEEISPVDAPLVGVAAQVKTSSDQKKKRVSKPKKLSDDASGELAAMVDGPAIVTPTSAPPIVLSPEQQSKVDKLLDRINQFSNELVSLERCSDILDTGLELENLLQQSAAFLNKQSSAPVPLVDVTPDPNAMVASQTESELVESQSQPVTDMMQLSTPQVETVESRCKDFMKAIIARSVHGSSKTLSQLVELVKRSLEEFRGVVAAHQPDIDENSSKDVCQLSEAQKTALLAELNHAANVQTLGEDIKSVARRESLGHRLKSSHPFEDDAVAAMWRWETFSAQHFSSPASSAILKEAKLVRGRYSRVVKAISKVIEQVSKIPYDESKVAPLEEKVSKAVAEVEKAKEKRREIEAKREKDAQEKASKEALKEQKRKEKEEADLLKKQQQEAAAKAKADQQAEKEKKANEEKMKQAEKLRKQQTALKSFFGATAPSSSAAGLKALSSSVALSSSGSASTCNNSGATTSSISLSVATKSGEPYNLTDEDRYLSFINQVNRGMTMAEILADHRKQRQLRNAFSSHNQNNISKKCRTIRISVLASSATPKAKSTFNAFEDNEDDYVEMKEKVVNNKIKTFFFHEDYRPAYVGTFSKSSSIISGRNPLNKDNEVFNYEYDSEEEWEEEEEGEDIMESGDEEEEEDEANELEYDDMFRRDDDFGSDVDEDGEDLQVMTIGSMNRVRQEVLGPRFVSSVQTNELETAVDNSSNITKYSPDQIIVINDKSKVRGMKPNSANTTSSEMSFVPCLMSEDDDLCRLAGYATVVYAPSFCTLTYKAAVGASHAEKEKGNSKIPRDKASGSIETTSKKKDKTATTESTPAGEVGEASVTSGEPVKEKMMKGFDETKIVDLIRLIHGKKDGIDKLIISFHESNPFVAKAQIKKRISEISEKTKHSEGYGSPRFLVKQELLVQHCPDLAEQTVVFTPVPDKKKKRAVATSSSSGKTSADDEVAKTKKSRTEDNSSAVCVVPIVTSPNKLPTVAPSTPTPARTITSLFQAAKSLTPSKNIDCDSEA